MFSVACSFAVAELAECMNQKGNLWGGHAETTRIIKWSQKAEYEL
jgi:hypothetical protein